MPKWLLPIRDGYISFFASKDLYEKIQELFLSVVFRMKEGHIGAQIFLDLYVNGKCVSVFPFQYNASDSNHVLLRSWKPKDLWGVPFTPNNDWNHFQLILRGNSSAIVKKCGFRLICKALENDLEVLIQENQLFDPALIYEVLDENQTSTEKDRSSKFVHKSFNVADFSIEKIRYSRVPRENRMVVPGKEIPKEYVIVDDRTISFLASKDLYNIFSGLVLCLVFSAEDGEKEISFDIVPHINGQMRNVLSGNLGLFDSDRMWFQYLYPNMLWGVLEGAVDFDQFEERFIEFSLTVRVLGGSIKQLGYLLVCRQLKDDLKVVLKDNHLMDEASISECPKDDSHRGLNFLQRLQRLQKRYFFLRPRSQR